jgi:hypothetical protein
MTTSEPSPPPLGRRAVIVAVVLLGLLPLIAFASYTYVWRTARGRSGPPIPEALYPLPDGVVVLEEGTGCDQGNYVPCWRVLIVEHPKMSSAELGTLLAARYRDRGYMLERQGPSWSTPCTGEPVCLVVAPLGQGRVRLEARRMSDSL